MTVCRHTIVFSGRRSCAFLGASLCSLDAGHVLSLEHHCVLWTLVMCFPWSIIVFSGRWSCAFLGASLCSLDAGHVLSLEHYCVDLLSA